MLVLMAILGFIDVRHQLHVVEPPQAAQSWDQANLKRHDIGCPTAIFIAPEGNLKECP